MATSTPNNGNPSNSTLEADTKISNDLIVLKEKMDLLETMLHPADIAAPKLSVLTNEAIRSVIGYLDACAPRMIELVEACTSTSFGVLSEEVFGEVLACNDRLQQLLEDVDTRTLTETPATTTAASAPSATSSSDGSSQSNDNAEDILTGDVGATKGTANNNGNPLDNAISQEFGDLLLGNDDPFADTHASIGTNGAETAATTITTNQAGPKTTGESDEFQVPVATGQPVAGAKTADPFDDFFAERTSQN